MKTVKKHFWVGFLAVAFFAIFPSLALADGEPGSMCPGCETAKCKYIAPPYTGSITVAFVESCTVGTGTLSPCVLASGSVTQVGKNPSCQVNFPSTYLGGGKLTQETFQNYKPSDLRGSCLITLMEGGGFPCIVPPGYPELLAVGNMKYGTQPCIDAGYTASNCFTADVVIMEVMAH